MRIVCISDTHEKHRQVQLPAGDILIHAGDLTWTGKPESTLDFIAWFKDQPFKHKIFICGNHDFYFEHTKNKAPFVRDGIYFLLNSGALIDQKIKIWGSPYTPEFMNWAFMGRPDEMRDMWTGIPDGLDILITHGPPFGILDQTTGGDRAGCRELLKALEYKKPKLHIFGHIHEGYGISKHNGTTFINASLCNEDYNLVNKPVVVNI